MISLELNKVPTLFIQGFSREDVETIIEFVRQANYQSETLKQTILFIDTPSTPLLVEAIKRLKEEGYRVVFRDHHGIEGEPRNVRDTQKAHANEKLKQMLGEDCLITLRETDPACSSLVAVGEFEEALAIVADPDADGLTAAMKAAGIYYEGMDDDAALLDGEPALQVTGSEISSLLAKGIATLPSYTPEDPHERERTLKKLFEHWVRAVEGDEQALASLKKGEEAYDRAVAVSAALAKGARHVAPGVVLANVTDSAVFDPGTLNSLLEAEKGCKVTVLRKDRGPIAALHGIQYSLSVSREFHDEVDLSEFVPPGKANDPAGGVISNVTFLLHVSETVWEEHVLPALKRRFGEPERKSAPVDSGNGNNCL